MSRRKRFVGIGIGIVIVCVAVRIMGSIGLGGKDVRVEAMNIDTNIAMRPGNYTRRLTVQGRKRFYNIHVPPTYAKEAMPLVLVFHGGGSYPDGVRFESTFDRTADSEGFIVAYPAGTNRLWYPKDRLLTWNDGRVLKSGVSNTVDDVAFVGRVLDDITTLLAVDTKRVYAAGYSNGAQFTYLLAKKLPTRIAAISTVAGQRSAKDDTAAARLPISIMQFSGKNDTIGPYDGGEPSIDAAFDTHLDAVQSTITSWVTFDRCAKTQTTRTVGKAIETRWSRGCANGTEVVLWTLLDGGHTWPGGNVLPAVAAKVGPVNHDIVATQEMWTFFSRHVLP